MNILSVKKSIPLRAIWILDSEEIRQVKAISYDVQYTLRTELTDNMTYDDAFLAQNISFSTINSFIYDQLHQTIIYDLEGKDNIEKAFASHNNNFMLLPEMSDSCLVTALHSKFNAISHEHSFVESVHLDDNVEGLEYSYFSDDAEYDSLPVMEQWLGELSFWETPWWSRRDFSTFDNIALSKEELDDFMSKDGNQFILERMQDPITTIEKELKGEFTKEGPKHDSSGELVEVDFKKKVFKPRLVPKDK
tara:strand:- start:2311 stop:3057 length:747 start_codon:yes stop_codon:yes gene_type:complete